ncbi:MAG: hypothetical protein HOI19_20135 [Rhodospirillaceae bacterium]|nr:hypothetical protein [Rhodospirillaceae bacterium]
MARLLDKGFAKARAWKPRQTAAVPKTKKFAPHKPKAPLNPKPALAKTIAAKPARNKSPSAIPAASRAKTPAPNAPEWSIQVGAYQKSNPARRAAQQAVKRIRNLTKHTRIHIAPHQEGDNLVYRARLVGFTKSHAQAACKRLKRRRMGCVAIPPAQTPVS